MKKVHAFWAFLIVLIVGVLGADIWITYHTRQADVTEYLCGSSDEKRHKSWVLVHEDPEVIACGECGVLFQVTTAHQKFIFDMLKRARKGREIKWHSPLL